MSNYDIKKAASKLSWRLGKKNGEYKSFTPNDDDVKRLNTLLSCINREKKEALTINTLFAKLYIYELVRFIRDYETDILDNNIQKELSGLLNRPLRSFYTAFHEELKSNQLDRIIRRVVIEGKTITSEDLKIIYDRDYCDSQLDLMITEALNRFE